MTSAGAVLLTLCVGVDGADFDFVRGDVNHDGEVSIADVWRLHDYLRRDGFTPDCINTADVDDDGDVDGDDYSALFQHIVCDSAPPAPFPAAGPDPTPNEDPDLDCDFYGGAEAPIEVPLTRLEVNDTLAAGGADGRVTLGVAVHHPTPIRAYSGSIELDPAIVEDVHRPRRLSSSRRECFSGDRIGFGVRAISEPLPAGTDELRIEVCLKEGTPAGVYPLNLVLAEVLDAESRRRIVAPELVSGTLTVLSDVTASEECNPIGYFMTSNMTTAPYSSRRSVQRPERDRGNHMKQMSEREIAKQLPEILDQAGDEPIVIVRAGKPVGILRAWPEIDDSLDLARSDEFWRMIEARRGSKAVPWETAKKDLGIE